LRQGALSFDPATVRMLTHPDFMKREFAAYHKLLVKEHCSFLPFSSEYIKDFVYFDENGNPRTTNGSETILCPLKMFVKDILWITSMTI